MGIDLLISHKLGVWNKLCTVFRFNRGILTVLDLIWRSHRLIGLPVGLIYDFMVTLNEVQKTVKFSLSKYHCIPKKTLLR